MNTGLRGFQAASLPSLVGAVQRLLERHYFDIPLPDQPVSNKHISKTKRNIEIRAQYAEGKTLEEIAGVSGVSQQRVHQIVKGQLPPEVVVHYRRNTVFEVIFKIG